MSGGEKRARSRLRVRLRSRKLAAPDGTFIADCLIHDRSSDGARLRLEDSRLIPDRLLLFDDERQSLTAGTVAWRRKNEVGIRFAGLANRPSDQLIARKLSGKYYAL